MLSVSEVCSGTRKSFSSTPTLFLPASSLNLLCVLKKTVGGWGSSSRRTQSKTDGGKCDVCAVADTRFTQSSTIKYRLYTNR